MTGIFEDAIVNSGNAPKIDPKLLELMACPLTKGLLVYDADRSELVSKSAMLAYPIRDGIPIMLPSEARDLREPPEAQRRRKALKP